MEMEEARGVLVEDSRELLAQFEEALLRLHASDGSDESIHNAFRAVHTLKGNVGMFGLDDMMHFAHSIENLLDAIRSNKIQWSNRTSELLLRSKDALLGMIDNLSQGGEGNADPTLRETLSKQIQQEYQSQSHTAHVEDTLWILDVDFGENSLQHGIDPVEFILHLDEKVSNLQVKCILDSLPPIPQYDPTLLYVNFHLEFQSKLTRQEILDLFRMAPHAKLNLNPPAQPSIVEQASTPVAKRVLRLDVGKLDRVIDLVGELVIASASARSMANHNEVAHRIESAERVQSLVENIRDASLTLRMLPVNEVFHRFPRLVHELSRTLGKHARLELGGVDTQLDKSMAEKLVDPLTHIIRNALDHGIELPAERKEAGKDPEACLRINAWHETGSILIEVSDDGRGIHLERVKAKAVERGLADSNSAYSEEEIFQFLFQPGFSTSTEVTEVSGRGVGLDVVQKSLQDLRGAIEVHSELGKGCTFRLRLPLSLAIIDGFLFYTGDSAWVLPLEQVVECLDFTAVEHFKGLARTRGEAFPVFRLRDLLPVPGALPLKEKIIVVQHGKLHLGLVVDRLLGQEQVVIKPLGPLFRKYTAVNGTVVLGNGQIAMILDIAGLERLGRKWENRNHKRLHEQEVPL